MSSCSSASDGSESGSLPSAPSYSRSAAPSSLWFPLPSGFGSFVRIAVPLEDSARTAAATAPPETVFVVDISGSVRHTQLTRATAGDRKSKE